VFLGRIDNVVNSGIKLISEQIEEQLSAYIPSRFFVGGIADADFGEKTSTSN
jgi:O-succinylbenzoic acid--CoA ligase